jgi:hypothetical protein
MVVGKALVMLVLLRVWTRETRQRHVASDAPAPDEAAYGIMFPQLSPIAFPAAACALARWLVVPAYPEGGFYVLWLAVLLGYAASFVLVALSGYSRDIERFELTGGVNEKREQD